MKGRYKFAAVFGHEHDGSLLRTDFNTAKIIGNVRYGKHYIFYQAIRKWMYIDYNDIVWAYRRLEDVQGKLCCGTAGFEIHSLMLVTRDKKRVGIPLGEKENAVAGLDMIKEHNAFVDIGYSKDKEERYL